MRHDRCDSELEIREDDLSGEAVRGLLHLHLRGMHAAVRYECGHRFYPNGDDRVRRAPLS